MAMFLAEITFLVELALFAAGLALWHRGREASAGLLRGAGAVLVVGSVLTALCTGYFSVRYYVQGELDHAYPTAVVATAPAAMHPGDPSGAQRGMSMQPGRMHPGRSGERAMPMSPRDPGTAASPAPREESDHLEHHPEAEAQH